MNDFITFTDQEGNVHTLPLEGQGPAVPANQEDLDKDEHGYTNPNLHRRIDPQPPTTSYEVAPKSYKLFIGGKNSHRTTETFVHDEDSETCEIP